MRGFRPGLLPTLVVFSLLPLLLWLGFWQLDRAGEKRLLLTGYEARRLAQPIALSELKSTQDPAYTRVRLQGHFDPEHSFLLDSRIRDGKAGVELLQPFFDEPSARWWLLNRGWLPWPDRRIPPQFNTPQGSQNLNAWVYIPLGKNFLLQQAGADTAWPRLLNEVDAAALWPQLEREGAPWELRIEAGPTAYRADWPVVAMGPEKHLGYAVQWFALALALLLLFIYFGWHNARTQRDEFSSGDNRE